MAFHPDTILKWLPDPGVNCHVAYSGGMDSHVLLYAMARLREAGTFTGKLSAVHINHGLNPDAAAWASHCEIVCRQLDVPLDIVNVTVDPRHHGLENAARQARYKVFTQSLDHDTGVVLTAHHLDDQVETLLFRLLRGTGIRGLAGIHSQRPLGAGLLVRPLLGVSRGDLLDYARQEHLDWIEDDSNTDEALDRNFLRHRVVPALAERWPGYRKNLQRLAGLAAEGQALMEEIGARDLASVRDGIHRLNIPALLAFSNARRRNIVRSWFLEMESAYGIPVPDLYVIDRIFSELVPATDDAEPVICWHKDSRYAAIRRFNDRIYLVLPSQEPDRIAPMSWQIDRPLQLQEQGTLFVVETEDEGFLTPPDGRLEIRFRQGGESAKPAGRKTRTLKKILQDYHVPPWLRDTMPLFFIDDELLAVGDLFVTDRYRVRRSDAGGKKIHRIRWDRSDLHCGY